MALKFVSLFCRICRQQRYQDIHCNVGVDEQVQVLPSCELPEHESTLAQTEVQPRVQREKKVKEPDYNLF